MNKKNKFSKKNILRLFFILLLISLILLVLGCKVRKTFVKEETSETERMVAGIATSGKCYVNEELVCMDAIINPDQVILMIKNSNDATLYSAYVVMGDCKSDKIDVDNGKIVTFVMNNCPTAGIDVRTFNLIYTDGIGSGVTVEGVIDIKGNV